MTQKNHDEGIGFLNAGFYFQDQYVCQYVALNIGSFLATIKS